MGLDGGIAQAVLLVLLVLGEVAFEPFHMDVAGEGGGHPFHLRTSMLIYNREWLVRDRGKVGRRYNLAEE